MFGWLDSVMILLDKGNGIQLVGCKIINFFTMLVPPQNQKKNISWGAGVNTENLVGEYQESKFVCYKVNLIQH